MSVNSTKGLVRRVYSIREFCEVFGVSRSTVYRLFANKSLTPLKLGTKTLIRANEAEEWLASLDTSVDG